jgi:hypothetical protein
MRGNSVKLATLAGLALLGGAVGLNCGKTSNNPNGGDLKLAVVLPGGVHIDNVTYQVLSSSNATIAGPGTFSVTDPNATISLDIVVPVTPTGDAGDEVTLTATDSLGNNCTGTSPRFPVLAGTNPAVTMTLSCGSNTASGATGNIGVTANVVEGDVCPSITSGVVAPDQVSVLGTANVAATATGTSTLTYAWAPATNFAAPTAPATTYTCTASGTQTFTLTVTDSHMPTPCSTQATFTITCVATTTSTGGTTGTGGVATGGTPGTGGVATGGTPGTGGVATGGTPGTGGIVATGGTTGTGGMAATGGVTGAGGDPAACITCEQSGLATSFCAQISPPGGGSATTTGCDGFTGTLKTDCYALLDCLRGSACRAAIHNADTIDPAYGESGTYPQPFDDPHPCLCGNSTLAACVALTSGWTGVCAAQFEQSAADSGLSVGNAFANATTPVGVAVNLSLCDIDNSCETQCGTTP